MATDDTADDLAYGYEWIEPAYRSSTGGTIPVYGGNLQLLKGGYGWTAAGDLEFSLQPEPRFRARFAGSDQWITECAKGFQAPSVRMPADATIQTEVRSVVSARPDNEAAWAECHIRLLERISQGNISSAQRLILHIIGPVTECSFPECDTDIGKQGQLVFSLPGWNLRLAAGIAIWPTEADFPFVMDAVPHRLPFDEKEAMLLLRRVLLLLTFIAGKEVGVGPIAGLDDAGQVIWAQWADPWVARSGFRWCEDQLVNDALPVLADGLSSLGAYPGLEWCVDLAISILHDADTTGRLDSKIPTACSGLELLAWSVLQHHQWATEDSLNRLSAASRVRLLLKWADIPIDVPSSFGGLLRRRDRLGQPSLKGPDLVFNVRNRVVHPPKNLQNPDWPQASELFEALQLAKWYLELTILRILGYNSNYASRIHPSGQAPQIEAVPWRQQR